MKILQKTTGSSIQDDKAGTVAAAMPPVTVAGGAGAIVEMSPCRLLHTKLV